MRQLGLPGQAKLGKQGGRQDWYGRIPKSRLPIGPFPRAVTSDEREDDSTPATPGSSVLIPSKR